MIQIFLGTFFPLFKAMMQLAIIATLAGLLVKKNIIKENVIDGLSKITVYVFLPCLIFTKITAGFNPSNFPLWWLLPLSGIAIISIGLFFGYLLFIKELPQKNNCIALSSMPNAAYLILPIGQAIYASQFDKFAVYVFLFNLGVNPVLWSIGKYLSTKRNESHPTLKEFITPPIIANLLSILLVIFDIHKKIPVFISEPIEFLGNATIPIVTFVLGATLGSIIIKSLPPFIDIIRIISVKFILVPIIILIILHICKLYFSSSLLADFFIIQASSAPATGIILQIRTYGGELQKTGSMLFFAYLVCILAIPLWVSILRLISN